MVSICLNQNESNKAYLPILKKYNKNINELR